MKKPMGSDVKRSSVEAWADPQPARCQSGKAGGSLCALLIVFQDLPAYNPHCRRVIELLAGRH
jgi:hypothetical protein